MTGLRTRNKMAKQRKKSGSRPKRKQRALDKIDTESLLKELGIPSQKLLCGSTPGSSCETPNCPVCKQETKPTFCGDGGGPGGCDRPACNTCDPESWSPLIPEEDKWWTSRPVDKFWTLKRVTDFVVNVIDFGMGSVAVTTCYLPWLRMDWPWWTRVVAPMAAITLMWLIADVHRIMYKEKK